MTTPMAYAWSCRFIETPIFTRVIAEIIDDESYGVLQLGLMLRPTQGSVLKGSGGLRKLRWAKPGAGKRGGVRIIYYWVPSESTFYMLYAYSKNEQADLTPAQARRLGQVVREEFP